VSRKRDGSELIPGHAGIGAYSIVVQIRRKSNSAELAATLLFALQSRAMTRTYPLLDRSVLVILTSAALTLAVPSPGFAQHSREGGGSSGHSSSGGSGGSSSGGSSGGGHSAPSGPSSDGARAVPRGTTDSSGLTSTSRSGDGTTGSVTRDGSKDTADASTGSSGTRSRDGRTTVGHAVARPPNANGGGTVVIVPGYYPWAYGGIGFGGYYGFYDPGWYDPYPPVYTGSGYGYEGSLRLKVKPREASVYVDGCFSGRVDDFDGVFQRLKIDAGPHRVEIRLDGYETLTFDVRIDPDRTTTYTGELKKIP